METKTKKRIALAVGLAGGGMVGFGFGTNNLLLCCAGVFLCMEGGSVYGVMLERESHEEAVADIMESLEEARKKYAF